MIVLVIRRVLEFYNEELIISKVLEFYADWCKKPLKKTKVRDNALSMPLYVTREVSKIWKRIVAELFVEWQLLLEKWKLFLFGLIFQYIHGVFAKIVHYLHRPAPLLPDIGFLILPELGLERAYISESLFSCIFFSFLLWTFHPFLFQKKSFHTILVWHRVLMVLVVCQTLRIVTFLSTQLPGPNYHCREGSPAATLPPPKNIAEVVNINFPYGVIYGCGDLIFSSHMIFAIVFVRTYQKYGTKRWIKHLAWAVNVVLSLLIIASRKHYTVDIVVAWYTVLLVFYFVDRQLSGLENTDRSAANASPLPTLLRAKDSRSKDESQKLMSSHLGSAMVDLTSETRQRTPINGKIVDEGNSATLDLALTGNQLV